MFDLRWWSAKAGFLNEVVHDDDSGSLGLSWVWFYTGGSGASSMREVVPARGGKVESGVREGSEMDLVTSRHYVARLMKVAVAGVECYKASTIAFCLRSQAGNDGCSRRVRLELS